SVDLVAGGVVLVHRRQREAVGILDGGLPALLVLVGVDDLAAVSVLIGRKQLASQPAVRVELHVLANIGRRVNDRGAVAGLIVAGEGEVAARILGADHEIGLTVLVAEILGVLVIFADGDRIARARAPVVVALAEVAAQPRRRVGVEVALVDRQGLVAAGVDDLGEVAVGVVGVAGLEVERIVGAQPSGRAIVDAVGRAGRIGEPGVLAQQDQLIGVIEEVLADPTDPVVEP